MKMRTIAHKIRNHRMLRGKLDGGSAKNRVNARSKHGDGVASAAGWAVNPEIHQRAFTAANPVALHDAHFFRPAFEFLKVPEQLFRIFSDAYKPLLKFALLHGGFFMPPATAIAQ